MGTHMKTTIEIATPLLTQAKAAAAREGATLRALVEEGLRTVFKARKQAQQFRLRKATFGGKGLQPDLRGAPWERIRDRAYEGRGA